MHIKNQRPAKAQSTPEGTAQQCDNPAGEITMLVSGIVGTASLVAVLVLLFVGGLALAAVDKHFDAGREH